MRHRISLVSLTRIVAALTALLQFESAAAADSTYDSDSPSISVLGGYMDPDSDRAASPGKGAALSFGWRAAPHIALEIEGSTFNLETHNDGTDFYRSALGANVLALLRPEGTTPYAMATLGVVKNDVSPDADDSTDPFVGLGLGVMSRPLGAYGLRVRLEARYVRDFFADDVDDLHAYLGVVIPLRKVRTVEVVRTEVKEVMVPREPEQIIVAPPAVDSDKDGVSDAADRCPGTIAGAPVDAFGCVRESAVIALGGVEFEPNSAQLTYSSQVVLESAVATLRGQPAIRAEVAGHTDNTGTEKHNLDLSRRRAASVTDYLVAAGIAADRLMPVGYGESSPIDTNETANGRTRNRRVELRVLSR